MEGLLAAEPAILVELQTIGIVLLVLESIVIPLLALGAGQRDLNAHGISPSRWYSIKNKPPHGGTLHRLPQGGAFVNENLSDLPDFFAPQGRLFCCEHSITATGGCPPSIGLFFCVCPSFFQIHIGKRSET